MKLTKGKLIAALIIVAVLAAAFWYGGNAPGLQGWTVRGQESGAVLEVSPSASGADESEVFEKKPGGEAEKSPQAESSTAASNDHAIVLFIAHPPFAPFRTGYGRITSRFACPAEYHQAI